MTVTLLTGCGASAVRVDGARDAAHAFEQALAARDYAAACELLAPETRTQLEQDGNRRARRRSGARNCRCPQR
ncbi:hypothetical protein ACFWFZ_02990 [Streptomyces sp. NPDC060232]|uniref:hypothetical protein n=1 Tax=Streptomyces sp. NPDC060232 TaxID=3347079 RepID=UPI0036521211